MKDSGEKRFSGPESGAKDSRGPRPSGAREKTSMHSRSSSPESECARRVPRCAGSDCESSRSSRSGFSVSSGGESESALSRKLQLVKLLMKWGLSFAGDEGDADPEEFLERLEECCDATDITDRELLSALPCVLKEKAARWFRVVREEVATRREFRRAFRRRFVREFDREDLLHDLRGRTQAPGERVASFLADFKYIVSRFKKPPSMKSQVEQAFRNLLPEFRYDIAEKRIETLHDIEYFGRCWERERKLDARYVPPPHAEDMRVPAAAFAGSEEKIIRAEMSDDREKEKSEDSGVREEEQEESRCSGEEGEEREISGVLREELEEDDSAFGSECTRSPAGRAQRHRRRRRRGRPCRAGPRGCAKRVNEAAACELVASVESTRTGGLVAAAGMARPPPPMAAALPQMTGGYTRSPKGATLSNLEERVPGECSRATCGPQEYAFGGVCYLCRALGHRRAECPEIRCYRCANRGHTIRTCPMKRDEWRERRES